MNLLRSRRPLRLPILLIITGVVGVWLLAECRDKQTHAGNRSIIPLATVKPVMEALANKLPPELKEANEAKWKAWAERKDDAVRARLERGALDSMINLLFFGTSFTTQPRVMTMNDPNDAVVQSRLDDFLQRLRNPERTSGSSFYETFSETAEWILTVQPDTRRPEISS